MEGLDTSSVTNMNQLFFGCFKLTVFSHEGMDVSSLKVWHNMFTHTGLNEEQILKELGLRD